MFARNLIIALIVVMFGSMAMTCFTASATDAVAQTQLPLQASSHTVAVQNVITNLATKAGMVDEKVNYVVSN